MLRNPRNWPEQMSDILQFPKRSIAAAIQSLPMPPKGAESDVMPSKRSPSELADKPLAREEVEAILFEMQQQPNWRREADKAADYYDGNQLDAETVQKLKERGQPPLITNFIKPTVDTVLGLEAKTRTDWIVRPEDDSQAEPDLADAMSIKLKHAEIESRADRACSDAYAAQVKTGLGWVEVSRDTDPFNPAHKVSYVHRREIAWDWRSEKNDLSDARYLVRRRWVDVEHAIAMMPQYAELFSHSVNGWSGFDPMMEQPTNLVQSWEVERDTKLSTSDWSDQLRRRVCLSEIWYRKWVKGHVMRLANGRVIEFDINNVQHQEALVAGYGQVREAIFQRIRLAWYCGPHYLFDIPSPYPHKSFPYVPFFGYREDLTCVPYGLVRSMISPQDEINARKSKQLWLLNSRRVITDSDAVADHAVAMKEVARPDAYIQLNPNRRPTSKFEVQDGTALVAPQAQALLDAKNEIAEASGIHKAMMGQSSNASSGLAINSLIDQGLTTLGEINDNFTFARRLVGEMLFSLVQEDLAQTPATVKLGSGSSERVIHLNQRAQDPETGEIIVVNDVSRLRARIVLDDVKSTPTYRMQVMTQLAEITKSLPPEAQGAMADLWVEASDLPGKQLVVDRLRTILNLPDDSPQGKQRAQQAAQEQKQQQQTMYQLEVETKTALIKKTLADAENAHATAQMNLAKAGQGGTDAAGSEIAAAAKETDALRQQIAQLQGELQQRELEKANRAAEIEAKSKEHIVKGRVELEKAKIAAAAQLKAAEIAAAASKESAKLQAETSHKIAKHKAETDAKAKADEPKEEKKETAPAAAPDHSPAIAAALSTLAQSHAAMASVMGAPRETKIVEDADGRAVGAVSKVATKKEK